MSRDSAPVVADSEVVGEVVYCRSTFDFVCVGEYHRLKFYPG